MKKLMLAAALLALALPAYGQDVPPTGGDKPPAPAPAPAASPPTQQPPAPAPPPVDPPPAPAPAPAPAPVGPTKASLAVMKFSYNEHVTETQDGVTRAYLKEVDTSTLTNKFITSLVQTRKFDVVDRDKLDKVLAEQQMGDSGLMDPSRAVKAGKLVGADYFLTGQISFFTASETIKAIPYVDGRYMHDCQLQIRVDMRIVDTRTSKIVAAEMGEAILQNKFQDQFAQFQRVSAQSVDDIQRMLCDKLTIKVIDGVYPIKVIGWSDGLAFLNRGEGGGLEVGQILEVFGLGEEMKDPDTGASLGFTESKLGTLRVTSVEAKFSKAQIVSGAQMPKGSICRKAKDAPPAPAPDQPKRGPQGW